METKVEYKYYRDLKHSYIIAPCNDVREEELGGYKLKIAENGRRSPPAAGGIPATDGTP